MWKTAPAWITGAIIIAGTAAFVCTPAAAQSMYRCGNSYQAFPCDTGQGKLVGSVGSAQSSYTPVSNAECAQRGAESLKIVWAREAGLIREKAIAQVDEKALSSAQKADARKLVADVYNKRGSAPEVRAAIETDCVAEKEKEAMAAGLIRPASSFEEKRPAIGTNEVNGRVPNQNRRETVASNNAASKREHCEKLSRRLEKIERTQRAGAQIQEMEALNQERRDLQRSQLDGGC